MAPIPSFKEQVLEEACNVLGDTYEGLIGSEIGNLLNQCGIQDPSPSMTKRKRLYQALSTRQRKDRCANNVVAFIQAAMNPVRYVADQGTFNKRREKLNRILAFEGYQLGDDGQLSKTERVATIHEARAKAAQLRGKLEQRNVHPDVLKFCTAELVADDYFHAVFESTKSVADKIRKKSGLQSDGSMLVEQAFGLGKNGIPLLAFNSLQSETERSEHTGLMNLLKGLFGAVRNVTAHEPRIYWSINEQDALDVLTLASMLHRRLDICVPTEAIASYV
jgi:uncharacterized protein (TIGR02391 family)